MRSPSEREVVDDDRRPVALEVFDGQPEILEVHAVAVQVDRGAAGLRRSSQNGMLNRTMRPSDGSNAEQVQVVRDGCVPRRRPIGVERRNRPSRSSSISGFCPAKLAFTASNSLAAAAAVAGLVSMCWETK